MSTQSTRSPDSIFLDDRDAEELEEPDVPEHEELEELEDGEDPEMLEPESGSDDYSRSSSESSETLGTSEAGEEEEESHSGASAGSSASTMCASSMCPEERTLHRLERLRETVRESKSFDDEDLAQVERVVALYAPKAARAREAREKQRRYADELRWMRAKLQERATLLDEAGIDFRAREFAPLARFFMAKQKKLSACLEGVAAQSS